MPCKKLGTKIIETQKSVARRAVLSRPAGTAVLVGDIVPELGFLTALQTLSLRDNHFTGIVPPELGKLTALRHLFLNNNNLRGTVPFQRLVLFA